MLRKPPTAMSVRKSIAVAIAKVENLNLVHRSCSCTDRNSCQVILVECSCAYAYTFKSVEFITYDTESVNRLRSVQNCYKRIGRVCGIHAINALNVYVTRSYIYIALLVNGNAFKVMAFYRRDFTF